MRKGFFSVVTIALFLLNGCSEKPQERYENVTIKEQKSFSKKEQDLVKRFSAYWHYRLKNQLDKSYQYELPYQRYLISVDDYKSQIDSYGEGTKVELASISYISPNIVAVKRLIKTPKRKYTLKDKWVYVNGTWYHKFFQNILPPKNKEEAEFQ